MERPALKSSSANHIDQTNKLQLELDKQIQKLAEDILPKQPYLVTLPTNSPWRSAGRQLGKWYAGTPFTEEEEQLQYLSFIPYQREYLGEEILLVSEGGWSDENGRLLRPDTHLRVERERSAAGTPVPGSQRKKISLNAYKNKGRGGSEEAVEMERAQASIKKADDAMKGKLQPHSKAPLNGTVKEGSLLNKKRSRDDLESNDQSIHVKHERSPHTEKKIRTSPPPKQDPRPSDRPKSPAKKDNKIPELESPTLPPTLDEKNLPPFVSPTLPPYLEKLLEQKPVKSFPNGGLNEARTNSPIPSSVRNGPELSPAPRVRIRNGDSPLVKPETAVKSPRAPPLKKVDGTTTKLKQETTVKAKESGSSKAFEKIPPNTTKETEQDRPTPRKKLRIILRYGKVNRKRVESLLRFAPRTKKPASTSIAPSTATHKRELSERPEKEASPRPEKRQKTDDTHTSSTRKIPSSLGNLDRPHTPIAPSVASPSLQSSAIRSNFSTPKKDLKSVAMRRVESTDGVDVRTPPTISRQDTPVSSERQSQQQNTSTKVSPPLAHSTLAPSTATESSDTRREWRNLHAKYHELGRKLKHEGSDLSSKRPMPDPSQAKLAAALWVEALITFLLANYCLERGTPVSTPDHGWRSMLPYWEFVRSQTRPYRDVYGLVLHLGSLIRNIIHRVEMERLARDPLPSENNNNGSSAPTPGSDGMTKSSSEDSEKYRQKYLSFKTELVSNFRELNGLWSEAAKRLSSERVKEAFPSTWAKKSSTMDREKERSISPGDSLGGDFAFPVDATTTALEGVRLGRRMLKEWCKNENVSWTPKLEL